MFIEQAYNKNFSFLKYLPIPIAFILLMIMNYLAVVLLNIDTESLIRKEVEAKGENRVFFEMVFPLSFALILLLLWVKFVHRQTIRSLTTARKKVDWKRIFFAFGLWGGLTIVITFADYFMNPSAYELNFKPIPFAILAVTAIILIPMQTSFEEYLFRGYLMQGIGVQFKSRLLPLLFTSVLFGIMHIANPEVDKIGYIALVYYIGTGLFLGVITLMDDGLELALGFHAANNLITALLLTSDWSAFQTHSIFKDKSDPSAGFDILLPVVIIFPILLFIFSRKYKWSGWKEKLTGRVELVDNEYNAKIG